MPKKKSISDNGLQLIKDAEGFRSKTYLDEAGLPTIGYGTLIDEKDEQWLLTAVIDVPTATQLLKTDLAHTERVIQSEVKSAINQNQYDALCSLVYNIGISAFHASTLLKKININPFDTDIRDFWMSWDHIGKKENEGLKRRRMREVELYFKV